MINFINTKLTTHATSAGAMFLYGYLTDIHLLIKDNFPIIQVLPIKIRDSLQYEEEVLQQFETYVHYIYERDKTSIQNKNSKDRQDVILEDRNTAWDNANVVLKNFIKYVNNDSNLQVINNELNPELITEGLNLENTIALKVILSIRVNCFSSND